MASMDRILYTATTSSSHVFGNITQAMMMYLKGHLPYGFLKDCGVSTSSPFRYYTRFLNKRDTFTKRELPYMTIKPNFEVLSPNDDVFLIGTHLARFDGNVKSGMQNFMLDKKKGFGLAFGINRYRITFEVGIQMRTYYQGMDLYQFLQNTMMWEIPEYIPTMLESMIPKILMIHAAECIGIDINKPENIPTFIQYMQERSTYPLTYKMRNSTSSDEFFIFYNQNILTTFSDLTIDEVQKKGLVEDMSVVMFKATCDFNAMGSYRMFGCKNTIKAIDLCLHSHVGDAAQTLDSYTPIYTFNRMYDDSAIIEKGYTKRTTNVIKTEDINDGKDDVLDLNSVLDGYSKEIIRGLVATGASVSVLYEKIMMKNDELMVEGKDYDIDWNTLRLTIHESDRYATYRLIFYINLQYYNNHIIEEFSPSTDKQSIDSPKGMGYKF